MVSISILPEQDLYLILQVRQRKPLYLILGCLLLYVLLYRVYGIVVVSVAVAHTNLRYRTLHQRLSDLYVFRCTYLKHLVSKSVKDTAKG